MSFSIQIPEQVDSFPKLKSENGFLQWISSVDHKMIGIMYLWTSLIFLIVGFAEAMLMRIQLAQPGNTVLHQKHIIKYLPCMGPQ